MAYNTTASVDNFTLTTLENAKTDLVYFLDPKWFPITGMLKSKCSRNMATETFIWCKTLHWENQSSTNLYN